MLLVIEAFLHKRIVKIKVKKATFIFEKNKGDIFSKSISRLKQNVSSLSGKVKEIMKHSSVSFANFDFKNTLYFGEKKSQGK